MSNQIQKLAPEKYRGFTITVVRRILGNGNYAVEATARVKGNILTSKGKTKVEVLAKIKNSTDRVLANLGIRR